MRLSVSAVLYIAWLFADSAPVVVVGFIRIYSSFTALKRSASRVYKLSTENTALRVRRLS